MNDNIREIEQKIEDELFKIPHAGPVRFCDGYNQMLTRYAQEYADGADFVNIGVFGSMLGIRTEKRSADCDEHEQFAAIAKMLLAENNKISVRQWIESLHRDQVRSIVSAMGDYAIIEYSMIRITDSYLISQWNDLHPDEEPIDIYHDSDRLP